jgi:phage/plasmid-like protein (TIGR03299 family)
MFSLLDSVLDATQAAKVTRENHDLDTITPAAPDFDPSEYAPTKQAAMARASLDVSTGRVAFMSARLLPWHGLGVVVDKATTSAEAIRFASLDWRVQKIPMQYTWNGTTRESKEAFAIVRADTGRQLATVGSRYAPIQNADAFGFMDELLKEYGARYETAGALYGGEKVFMLAHFPKQAFSVNGKDAVEPYVAICNPHDGTGCANCFPTSVRIVCANTYRTAGNQGAGKGLKIRHTGNIKSKIREARNALGMAVQSFDRFKDAADTMAHTRLEAIPFFNGVLDAVLDVTEAQVKRGFSPLEAAIQTTQAQLDLERKQFEAAAERRRDILSDIINRYESATNGNGGMRGTAWSAFNAVTESADHAKIGTRRVGTLDDQRSRRFENVLAGNADEMKQAAFSLAMKA